MSKWFRGVYLGSLLFLPNILCATISSQMGGASILKRIGFITLASLPSLILPQVLPEKWIRLLLLPAAFLLPCELQAFVELREGMSVGILASIAATTPSEALEFLRLRPWLPIASALSTLTLAIVPLDGLRFRRKPLRILATISLSLILVADGVRRSVSVGVVEALSLERSLAIRSWPSGILLRVHDIFRMRQEFQEIQQLRAGFDFCATRDSSVPEDFFLILVIGESSRKANWSHYGYPRQTTPLLSRRGDILWLENVRAPANLTMNSLPQLLTRATADTFSRSMEEKSILSAARQAGYLTTWVSTQISTGGMSAHLLALAREADTIIDAESTGSGDASALPVFGNLLHRRQRQMVVLHQHGSHSDYIQRSPRDRKRFLPEGSLFSSDRQALVNAYDNSILETDHVLDGILELVQSSGRPSALLYVSDHGENLLDDRKSLRLHGTGIPTKFELEVPGFVWLSRSFVSRHPPIDSLLRKNGTAPLFFQNLQATLLHLGGIRSGKFDRDHSLLSQRFRSGNRSILLPDGSFIR